MALLKLFAWNMYIARRNDVRLIGKINLALSVLAASLFVCNQLCDSDVLLGSRVRKSRLYGKRLKDVLVGQPVVPDRINIYRAPHSFFLLVYEADNIFWRRYPFVVVAYINEHVRVVEVRK